MGILFILLYFSVLGFFYILMKCAHVSLVRFSIPSFVLLFMLVFSYIGILPLYFQWDEYRVYSGVTDTGILLLLFLLSTLSITLMILGFCAANCLPGLEYQSGKFYNISISSRPERYGLYLAFSVCVLFLGAYLIKVPEIALVTAIKDPTHVSAARSLMGNAFEGSYHWYKTFFSDVMLFVLFAAYADKIASKRKRSLLFFLAVFVVASFAATMTTEKGPFINLLLGLFLVNILIRRGGSYPLRSAALFVAAGLAILTSFYMLFMGSKNMLPALLSIFSRIFTGQMTPAYWYLEYFPAHHDFLMGQSLPNPAGLLPFTPYRLPVEILNWKFPEYEGMGIFGSAPTVFWGEMYANFGIPGVIAFPFLVGFLLQAMDGFFGRLKNTPVKTAVVVWLALHYSTLSATGLGTFLADSYAIIVVAIFFMITFVARGCRISWKRKRKLTETACALST